MQDLLNLGRIMGIPDLEGPQLTELLRDVGRARRKVNATKHQKITIEDVNEGKLLKHPQYEHACAKLLRYLQVKFQGRALRRDNYLFGVGRYRQFPKRNVGNDTSSGINLKIIKQVQLQQISSMTKTLQIGPV